MRKLNFLFLKLLALNKPEWIYIVFGCLTSIINGGMEPAFAFILSRLVSVCLSFLIVIRLKFFSIGLRRMSFISTYT